MDALTDERIRQIAQHLKDTGCTSPDGTYCHAPTEQVARAVVVLSVEKQRLTKTDIEEAEAVRDVLAQLRGTSDKNKARADIVERLINRGGLHSLMHDVIGKEDDNMNARDALAKIQFQLVEAQGNMSGTSVAIHNQADRIIKELDAAGYEIVRKHPK